MMLLSPAAILALAAVVTATTPGPTQCDPKASAIPACAVRPLTSPHEKLWLTKIYRLDALSVPASSLAAPKKTIGVSASLTRTAISMVPH